jgi:cytochrome b561
MIHGLTAYLVALLVGIHILAALYHQFIRKDNLLARMWYGSR